MTRDEQIEAVRKVLCASIDGNDTETCSVPCPACQKWSGAAIAAYEATLEPIAWSYKVTRDEYSYTYTYSMRVDPARMFEEGDVVERPLYAIPKP